MKYCKGELNHDNPREMGTTYPPFVNISPPPPLTQTPSAPPAFNLNAEQVVEAQATQGKTEIVIKNQ